MNHTRIKVENLAKQYRLGEIGTGTFSHDLNQWWHKIRGKRNPYAAVGELNNRTQQGDSPFVWALNKINFELNQGEVLGIIGKNGAGKSTLLKILSKVTGPTRGRIEITGRIGALLEVGTGMHPELTGRENIFLNGALLGMTKREISDKLDDIIDFSGVERYIDTPFKRYSSGMRVRLGFAVAAFLEPEILIVDEVLAVGDAEFQQKCMGKMGDVAKAGRTILFVSHNISAVQKLCTKGLLLSDGEQQAFGEINDIVNLYLNSNSNEKALEWKRETTSDSAAWFNYIRIYQENKAEITTKGSLVAEFEYELKKDFSSLKLHAALLGPAEDIIFSSAPEDSDIDKPLRKGKYKAQVVFPQDLLVSKLYTLKLIMWDQILGEFIHYDVNEKIRFQPIETVSLINNTSGGRSGIIAIKCNWQIN